MVKKLSAFLIAGLIIIAAAMPALAIQAGEERVTLGADLTTAQAAQIYADFGIEQGSVKQILLTNDEERAYLSGLVPDSKIGTAALSSIYLVTLEQGEGIRVTTNNINWCTDDMYINALITAGVENAEISVSAPFAVSGTAALAGIYKAYEDITGITLNQTAKQAAVEELVITGSLAQVIGSSEATELINELKKILDQTQTLTDEELRAEILNIAQSQNLQLTDDQITQIIGLCRTLEGLDVTQLTQKITQLGKTMETVQKTSQGVSTFFESVRTFSDKVIGFFTGLFGGK